MTIMAKHYRWREAAGEGVQHLVLDRSPGQITAEGMIVAGGEAPFAARFRLLLDSRWRTRRLSVALLGNPVVLVLLADGKGGWTDAEGHDLPALEGVQDVDISATPFTNTLPLRRLRTAVGKSVDIDTAHVDLPSMTVKRDAQRYTRLEERSWRYESRDSDFTRDITVDEDGVVISYPGLFERV
jgi:uncharacterized protein